MKSSRSAFSLIEMLVVISVILVLIAMLQPALRKAKVTARTTECATRLKNIGIASHAYADDNNEYVVRDYWFDNNNKNSPGNYGHYSLVGRYSPYVNGPRVPTEDDDDVNVLLEAARVNEVWRCPAEPNKDYALTYVTNGVDFSHYAATSGYTSGPASKWTAHPGSPSEVAHVFEANTINFHTPTGLGVYDVFTASAFTFFAGNPTNAPRLIRHDDGKHGGETNVLFFDTHVETRKLTPESLPLTLMNPLDTTF